MPSTPFMVFGRWEIPSAMCQWPTCNLSFKAFLLKFEILGLRKKFVRWCNIPHSILSTTSSIFHFLYIKFSCTDNKVDKTIRGPRNIDINYIYRERDQNTFQWRSTRLDIELFFNSILDLLTKPSQCAYAF